MTASDQPFRVLCVCEGNICRSPVAAVLLQDALGPDIEVSSVGTRAVVGAPVAPQMAALLPERLRAGAATFRARQLQPAQLRGADLVLTLTTRQRGQAVELAPAAVRRTFTLAELARLLGDVDPGALPSAGVAERLRAAVPVAVTRRAFVRDPRVDDIRDPYGREDAAYARAFGQIADAVERITAVILPGGRSTARETGQSTAPAGSDAG